MTEKKDNSLQTWIVAVIGVILIFIGLVGMSCFCDTEKIVPVLAGLLWFFALIVIFIGYMLVAIAICSSVKLSMNDNHFENGG